MFTHCFLHRILMSVVADEKQVLSGKPLMDSRKVSDAFHLFQADPSGKFQEDSFEKGMARNRLVGKVGSSPGNR